MVRFTLLDFEQLLNTYSGKRYHLRQDDVATIQNERFSIYEIVRFGEERKIIGDLSGVQMISYLQRHLKVELKEDELTKSKKVDK